MPIHSPRGHKPRHIVHDPHAHEFQLPLTEERLERLENDVHTLARLVFSARYADKQDQIRKSPSSQQQKEQWKLMVNAFDAPPTLSTGAKTIWSQDRPMQFASPKQSEKRPAGGSLEAKSGGKLPAKMCRYLFAVVVTMLCSITIWLSLGGEPAFGDLYQAAEWLKEMYAEKWMGA
ncbi:uncharacterized protein PgNI_03321 [Pyricularia grisea]|uniref:Uncharacterized protein n=1 Tax=Pyricularia grisea TaxID=148305 RepID=A0A6P8BDE5_PYRGI|nr:uncharacterized protein PgNI_03321 [Pyricularia grisea]TLD13896.1 hypothetical protein PgNI_03321 [Pyricularia grisea]